MSRTAFIGYRNDGFWAYDVAVGVLLKHLLDVSAATVDSQCPDWLRDCIDHWRVNAILPDLGIHLDESWSESQIEAVCGLLDRACGALKKRLSIPAEEMAAWDILDGKGVFARGARDVSTAPVAELGDAVQLLLRGALPESPGGTRWFYGVPEGKTTIRSE